MCGDTDQRELGSCASLLRPTLAKRAERARPTDVWVVSVTTVGTLPAQSVAAAADHAFVSPRTSVGDVCGDTERRERDGHQIQPSPPTDGAPAASDGLFRTEDRDRTDDCATVRSPRPRGSPLGASPGHPGTARGGPGSSWRSCSSPPRRSGRGSSQSVIWARNRRRTEPASRPDHVPPSSRPIATTATPQPDVLCHRRSPRGLVR